jgi:hypothetical protein
MPALPSLLKLAHLIGLALAVGAATAKLTLLLKCRSDHAFVPVYVAAVRPITRLIILGLVLLTLSGIGWLLVGYPITALLVVKLVLVAMMWALGPVIDNVVEPKFLKLAPQPGEQASAAFGQAQQHYLLMEVLATGLFYVIVGMWVLA